MSELSNDEYRRRDIRIKCNRCRRWMMRRLRPSAPTVTQVRRGTPHAGECRDCVPSALSIQCCKGCKECEGFAVHLGVVFRKEMEIQ